MALEDRRQPGGGQTQRLQSGPLSFSRCLGDGEPREGGSSRERIPPPLHPSRGTALKSCGVCHRPATPRMRIGEVEFFPFFSPPFPLSFQPPLVLQLKKIFFSPLRTAGERGVRREGERVRQLARRARGWVGGSRSLRWVSLSAGHRIAWKAAASSKAPPPPPRVRFGAAAAERAPPAASAAAAPCPRPSAARLLARPPLGSRRQTRRWAAPPAMDRQS